MRHPFPQCATHPPLRRGGPFHHRRRLIAVALAATLGPLAGSTPQAEAAMGRAEGTLTTKGTSVPLEHALVESYPDSWVVLVTDRQLGPGCGPFDGLDVAAQEPLVGVLFGVDRETLQIAEGTNALFHPDISIGEGLHAIRGGLQLERSGDGFARGTLTDSVAAGEQTVDFAIRLALPLDHAGTQAASRTVSGADSRPAKRFVELVEAVVAGDVEKVKGLSTAEMRSKVEEMPPQRAAELLLGAADAFLPREITITGTEVEGDRAVVTATGFAPSCRGSESGDGRIELARESGDWKVALVRFDMRHTSGAEP